MNAQNAHAHEDRLLDFAYGELPASEAQALEQHVQGCARCTKALADIRGVRTTMAQLSSEPAPDAGLESLLAYAQQSARRAAAGPEPKPSRWRRFLLPAVGLATVGTFGLLTLTVSENVDLSPNLSRKAAPALAMEAAKQDSSTQAKSAPSAPAPAPPSSATLEVDVPEGDADALASAPRELEFSKNQVEAKVKRKDAAAARPSDWMNAGGGGALLERRAEAEAPRKKVSKAVRDDAEEFAALEQSSAGAPAMDAPPKEEAPGVGSLAKQEPAPRRSSGKLSDKAMGAKGDSLRLGEAAYGRGLGTDDESVAADAPPPPPSVASAPVVQAAPMAPAATGSIGSIGGAVSPKPSTATSSARAEAAKPAPVEKSASKEAMAARDLSAQAQAAANQGDRAREARLLRAALSAGASGSERLALLSRLCESESVQGRTQEAAAVCGQIITEAPGSSAAQLAQRRLRQGSSPAAPAAPAGAAPAQPAQ
ncbi:MULTISPECIES: anti-sigma factor family protein [unclassified Corallococcus]|uniref:anti-sigma factor family protein n=1 Tax=unclassified Corallococcus TaxID=2685029 RepID=UPI001A8CC4DA|nr:MULTISPECIES: zf-HC2 domain-containing protein [unclassified Corallococcus]MBN9684492.1 zf-HC2 domain-containing protein [Corallococcus sp. NCSPR001]WAS84031.1 zf-HC2 domain-containing protein [Corallococcus sp. NCRR]